MTAMSPHFIIFHGEALEIWDALESESDRRPKKFTLQNLSHSWVGVCSSDMIWLRRSEKKIATPKTCVGGKSPKSITSITPTW